MQWQERLMTLQRLGKWRLGLWLALEFYRAHMARRGNSSRADAPHTTLQTAALGKVTSAAAGGGGDLQQLEKWLLTLLVGFDSYAKRPLADSHGPITLSLNPSQCRWGTSKGS